MLYIIFNILIYIHTYMHICVAKTGRQMTFVSTLREHLMAAALPDTLACGSDSSQGATIDLDFDGLETGFPAREPSRGSVSKQAAFPEASRKVRATFRGSDFLCVLFSEAWIPSLNSNEEVCKESCSSIELPCCNTPSRTDASELLPASAVLHKHLSRRTDLEARKSGMRLAPKT